MGESDEETSSFFEREDCRIICDLQSMIPRTLWKYVQALSYVTQIPVSWTHPYALRENETNTSSQELREVQITSFSVGPQNVTRSASTPAV